MSDPRHDHELDEVADAIAVGSYELTDMPAELPPATRDEPKVVRSLRLSPSTDRRLRVAAAARNQDVTRLMRDLLEHGLDELEKDGDTISRSHALRALEGAIRELRSLPPFHGNPAA